MPHRPTTTNRVLPLPHGPLPWLGVLAALALALSPSCSSDGGTSGGDDGPGTGVKECPGVPAPGPGEYAPRCCSDEDCKSTEMCAQGVCAIKVEAGSEAAITDPELDNEVSKDPIEYGCTGKTVEELVQGLPTGVSVTMWGRVDRFGAGHLTENIEIAVFKAADFKPEACEGVKGTDAIRTCMHDESKVGKPIAKVVSLSPKDGQAKDWVVKSLRKDGEECTKDVHLECPLGYLCDKFSGFVSCGAAHGVYAVEGIPTNVRLIVRASSVDPDHPAGWRDSYTWDVVLMSNRLDQLGEDHQLKAYVGKPTYRFNPTIVGLGQWVLVPTTMNLGKISTGNGVIGGRVRDCGTDKRPGWPIVNAKVTPGVRGAGLSYFNDSESDTVPSKQRTSTNVLGRFALINMKPGANRVIVSGRLGGKDVVLGAKDLYVVPDALVITSIPGYVPHLNK